MWLTYWEQVCSRELGFVNILLHLLNPYLNIRGQEYMTLLHTLPFISNCMVEGKWVWECGGALRGEWFLGSMWYWCYHPDVIEEIHLCRTWDRDVGTLAQMFDKSFNNLGKTRSEWADTSHSETNRQHLQGSIHHKMCWRPSGLTIP